MSKRKGYTEIPIPAEDFDELTRMAKKHGFKSLEEVLRQAVPKYIEKQRREVDANE